MGLSSTAHHLSGERVVRPTYGARVVSALTASRPHALPPRFVRCRALASDGAARLMWARLRTHTTQAAGRVPRHPGCARVAPESTAQAAPHASPLQGRTRRPRGAQPDAGSFDCAASSVLLANTSLSQITAVTLMFARGRPSRKRLLMSQTGSGQ